MLLHPHLLRQLVGLVTWSSGKPSTSPTPPPAPTPADTPVATSGHAPTQTSGSTPASALTYTNILAPAPAPTPLTTPAPSSPATTPSLYFYYPEEFLVAAFRL